MTQVLSIGGYSRTPEDFFQKLSDSGVSLFIDVRQRRLVRGPAYRHLNASKLQDTLAANDIQYAHLKDLAPTSAIRSVQKEEDAQNGTKKRDRTILTERFVAAYRHEILGPYDLSGLARLIAPHRHVCFFCVERDHRACHRSLTTEALHETFGLDVRHL